MEEKSANKRWKESGTTLSFKEWIDRENKKNESEVSNLIPFEGLNLNSLQVKPPVVTDSIQKTMDEQKELIRKTAGYKTVGEEDKSKVLGLNKSILIFSGVLILGSIGFYFYKKAKK